VLAPLGYVIRGTKTRAAERFVLCSDAHGEIERFGLFALRRVEEETHTPDDVGRSPPRG
jgi:hypothetical protein